MRLFYSTDPAPCPYLPGRVERRVVTFLDGAADEDERHDALLRAGFRRSHRAVYRPACPGCEACVPVRVPVAGFAWTRAWRRIERRNADLTAAERPTAATAEQFELFRRYLGARHAGGGMGGMDRDDYRAMVEEGPASSRLVEFRAPPPAGGGGRLVAACLTDYAPSGLSGVYKFFDPAEARRSLGTYVILWHLRRAAALGLPYVYLGYWIALSPKMAYKARFRPLERLTPRGWETLAAAAEEAAGP